MNTENTQISLNPIEFFASKKSVLAKTRWYVAIGFLIGIVPLIFVKATKSNFSIVIILIVMGAWLLIDSIIKKQLKFGKPLITLTDDYFESPNLIGKIKKIAWNDIELIKINAVQGNKSLILQLKQNSNKPNLFGFKQIKKLALALTPFSPEDQEEIFEATIRKQSAKTGIQNISNQPLVNELREVREFHENLASLQPHTWMTYTLISLNVLIWIFTLTKGATFIGAPVENLFIWGGNAASEVQKGEWWRMLTATFLHNGFMHVANNMIGLFYAGVLVERIYGHRLFLIIYFGSGLMGSALSLHYSAQNAVSVGASGAVFGVAGALLVAVFQHREKLPKTFSNQAFTGIGFFVLYSLVQGFSKPGIDNAAHIGGLIGGCLAAYILPERFDFEHYKKVFFQKAVIAITVLSISTVSLASFASHATLDQGRVFASSKLITQATGSYIQELKNIQQEHLDLKAGKITEQELDDRSRAIHAPVFKAAAEDLSKVVFRPGDKREPFIRDIRRSSELFAEMMAMDSVTNQTTQKIEPANPQRMDEINRELMQLGERIAQRVAELKKTKSQKN